MSFVSCTVSVQICVSEFRLWGMQIVGEFMNGHKVNADNVVIQLLDDIQGVCEFLPVDPKDHRH
jgi:hypothetical protein